MFIAGEYFSTNNPFREAAKKEVLLFMAGPLRPNPPRA